MSAIPSISHPTNRPNYTVVTVGDLTLEYSYSTLISISGPSVEGYRATIENYWGQTTGRHLNLADGGGAEAKKARLSRERFNEVVAAATAAHDLGLTVSA